MQPGPASFKSSLVSPGLKDTKSRLFPVRSQLDTRPVRALRRRKIASWNGPRFSSGSATAEGSATGVFSSAAAISATMGTTTRRTRVLRYIEAFAVMSLHLSLFPRVSTVKANVHYSERNYVTGASLINFQIIFIRQFWKLRMRFLLIPERNRGNIVL